MSSPEAEIIDLDKEGDASLVLRLAPGQITHVSILGQEFRARLNHAGGLVVEDMQAPNTWVLVETMRDRLFRADTCLQERRFKQALVNMAETACESLALDSPATVARSLVQMIRDSIEPQPQMRIYRIPGCDLLELELRQRARISGPFATRMPFKFDIIMRKLGQSSEVHAVERNETRLSCAYRISRPCIEPLRNALGVHPDSFGGKAHDFSVHVLMKVDDNDRTSLERFVMKIS